MKSGLFSDGVFRRLATLAVTSFAMAGLIANIGHFGSALGSGQGIGNHFEEAKQLWLIDFSILCLAVLFSILAVRRARKIKGGTLIAPRSGMISKLVLIWVCVVVGVMIILIIT